MKFKKRNSVVFLLYLVFFFGLALCFRLGMYGDSEQYLTMHIHREPLYPLLLWIVRNVFSKNFEFMILVVQAVFAAICTSYFVNYISDTFKLTKWTTGLIGSLALLPHIITPLFSSSHLVLTTGILSESICLPLFLVFLVELHKTGINTDKASIAKSFILAMLLSLIRGQMLMSIIMWIIIVGFRVIINKQYRRLLLILVSAFLFFGIRGVILKSYNYAFNGVYVNNTYGALNTLTNVMYVADREYGEEIEDIELRNVFYLLYDDMDEKQYNYKYAQGRLSDKIDILESVHDDLKFYVLESGFQQYFEKKGIADYIEQNILADRYSVAIMKEVLPLCVWRWGGNYLMLGMRGLIRNIAVVHPVLNIYAIVMFFGAFVMMIFEFQKNLESKEAWLTLIALLVVLGVSFSTALTIMCLQRYMIYGFTGFYTACFLLVLNGRSFKFR